MEEVGGLSLSSKAGGGFHSTEPGPCLTLELETSSIHTPLAKSIQLGLGLVALRGRGFTR